MQALLWDLNGVLVNDEAVQQECWKQTFQEAGVKLPDNWWLIILGRKTRVSLREIDESFSPERIENLIKRTRSLYGKRIEEITPGPGVPEMLRAAKQRGVKQAVVTGASPEDLTQALKIIDFSPYMEAVISGDQVEKSKPDPEGYLKACAKLRVAPTECWVIEDSPAGIKAGKAAGCKVLGLTTTLSPEQLREADLITGELSMEILEQLLVAA